MNDDEDLKKILRHAPTPPPRRDAQERAADAAWRALGESARPRNYRAGALVAASVTAVLLAGLSYAITQSTRSGAGDTASETNLISSAQLTQYPAGVRTAVVRMIVSGIRIEDLLFNAPSDFDRLQAANSAHMVFHPEGGNATYQTASQDVVTAGNSLGIWHFNAQAQIEEIGTTSRDMDASGNDIVAFLPDVTQGVCRRINDELAIKASLSPDNNKNGIPEQTGLPAALYTTDMDGRHAFPTAAGAMISGDFAGQPFGCLEATGDDGRPRTVYYHVIIER